MKQVKKYIYLFAAVAVSLTACVKERESNIDPSNSGGVIAFANTGSDLSGASSFYPGFYTDLGSLAAGATAAFNVNVEYSGTGDAPSDITVNLDIDTAALSQYNAENGTNYVVPAASVFTLPPTAVIKKGTRLAQVSASITNSADFDFSQNYALPVKITSATDGIISNNFCKAVYAFGLRNVYDGHYSLKGFSLRGGDPVKTGNFVYDHGMDLVTVGGNVVQFADLQVWSDLTGVGIGNPVFTVNADNSVTVSSSGGAINAPGYDSKYDPATKTFYVSFTWGAGPAARLAIDTLTYVGPRP